MYNRQLYYGRLNDYHDFKKIYSISLGLALKLDKSIEANILLKREMKYAYYFTQLSNLYEQQLSTTINSMIPIKFELEYKDEADLDLDSLNHIMRECHTNLRLTTLTAKNFEIVLNRDNKKRSFNGF